MNLVRVNNRLDRRIPATPFKLLLYLGYPRDELKGNPRFWQEHHHDLDWMLERARGLHRERIVKIHPDRGGDPEQAALLNAAMTRLEQLFARRGRPSFDRQRPRMAPPVLPAPPRRCDQPQCGQAFVPRRKNQHRCPACSRRFYGHRRRELKIDARPDLRDNRA